MSVSLLRRLLLAPVLALGLVGVPVVTAAPASAATTQFVGSKTVTHTEKTRKIVLRTAMRITYPKNDYPYYQGYISVRTYKKIHGKWKPYRHELSGAAIWLTCSNGKTLGSRSYHLDSGTDGFSKKYSIGAKTSTLNRHGCTAVRATFSAQLHTAGAYYYPYTNSDWG